MARPGGGFKRVGLRRGDFSGRVMTEVCGIIVLCFLELNHLFVVWDR